MTTRSKSRALCVVASMALMTITPASAFAYSGQAQQPGDRVQTDQNQSGRVTRGSRSSNRNQRQAAPAAPTPEQNLAAAQALLAANSVPCQMTEANLRGVTADQRSVYEVVCANSFGYLALGGAEEVRDAAGQVTRAAVAPLFIDCAEAQVTHDRQVAATPDAPPPPKCDLPANQNLMQVYTSLATQAGVDCTVDEAILVGRKPGNIPVYEIGCAGVQGFRINTGANGWEKASCIELAQANVTCSYTTKPEILASVKSWFNGVEGTDCTFSDARYMGANDNGAFYEIACVGAEGFIARLNTAKVPQQIYPCAEATQIGDGCKLTAATAPEATPSA